MKLYIVSLLSLSLLCGAMERENNPAQSSDPAPAEQPAPANGNTSANASSDAAGVGLPDAAIPVSPENPQGPSSPAHTNRPNFSALREQAIRTVGNQTWLFETQVPFNETILIYLINELNRFSGELSANGSLIFELNANASLGSSEVNIELKSKNEANEFNTIHQFIIPMISSDQINGEQSLKLMILEKIKRLKDDMRRHASLAPTPVNVRERDPQDIILEHPAYVIMAPILSDIIKDTVSSFGKRAGLSFMQNSGLDKKVGSAEAWIIARLYQLDNTSNIKQIHAAKKSYIKDIQMLETETSKMNPNFVKKTFAKISILFQSAQTREKKMNEYQAYLNQQAINASKIMFA